jgi:hypothetical protein
MAHLCQVQQRNQESSTKKPRNSEEFILNDLSLEVFKIFKKSLEYIIWLYFRWSGILFGFEIMFF